MILVDSSVWIAAWRGKDPSVTQQLSELIEKEEAVINGLIRTELLQGAKNKKHQNEIKKLLEPIPVQPFSENLWDEAAQCYLDQRAKGVTLTTIDSLIATHALLLGIPLWSLDTVFQQIHQIKKYNI